MIEKQLRTQEPNFEIYLQPPNIIVLNYLKVTLYS